MYQLLRNILFWFDAEKVHHFSMNMLSFFCQFSFIKNYLKKKFTPDNSLHSKKNFGLTFSNPVELAAGFDKNAKYLDELETLGFGFVEIGAVTRLPQDGNPNLRQGSCLTNRLPAIAKHFFKKKKDVVRDTPNQCRSATVM